MTGERPFREHGPAEVDDMRRQQRHEMIGALKIAVLGMLLDVAGIIVIAWKHTGGAVSVLISLTFALGLMIFNAMWICYRLGRMQVKR